MKITFLTDNYVDAPALKAEHGFSCLIETDQHRILFDTGQTETMAHNLSVLFDQLPIVDGLVLSHGHYDHTGGMTHSLETIKKMTHTLYCHEYIYDQHLKGSSSEYEYIGMDISLKSSGLKFIQNIEKTEIFENIFLSGTVERAEVFNADAKLFAEIDGCCIKDPFRDEQYLIIDDGGLVIITGCSHSGIINIIEHARGLFPEKQVRAVVGGFHLFRCEPEQMDQVVQYFESSDIEQIVTGHCTGLNGLFALKNALGNKVIPIKVGLQIEL